VNSLSRRIRSTFHVIGKSREAVAVAAVIGAVSFSALAATTSPAFANHPNTQCDYWEGSFSNLEQIPLQIHWIDWSYWSADLDYVAIRKDIAANETFHVYVTGGFIRTTTDTGNDKYLRTVIQRGGYSSASGWEYEYSHLYC
jgi:hypothetical protein